MSRKKKFLLAALGIGLVVAAAGLWAFQPWKAFTRSTVDEALPVAVTSQAPPQPVATAPEQPARSAQPEPPKPPEPKDLATGEFVSQEHDTSGKARVVDLGDGNRVLRLEGFSTSDGPDVHVWLSAATAGGEWGKYDDGAVVKLGKIKATDGNQNYAIPADAKLTGLQSVVIWCDRFNVAFGSAPLAL
ncbi:DM13 domain-containing protein [Amycolatopsis sp. 195334CR]|uniref:DM13 domain-containing protein n=1 Tax=Amycolatopsis sp. 195334CR TaxID=2814588 RepID=UPI001A8FD74F|nr:DM13 domain-containing protein [Amycolatopsis sp. 195334CR]MBN6035434.1 DM13 domain-containing protein [Amycolatopsis sp. 195334CR]